MKTIRFAKPVALGQPLSIPASEFALVWHRTPQRAHQWANDNGFLNQCGVTVYRDRTRHLFFVVPPTHEDYPTFFYRQWLALYLERKLKWESILQGLRDGKSITPLELMAGLTGMLYEVTGFTGLEPVKSDISATEWDEMLRHTHDLSLAVSEFAAAQTSKTSNS